MNTSKPISTISYNSEKFLKHKLKEWYKNRIISDYMYILHQAEEDEKKNHFHVWIKPNKKVDTVELQLELREVDTKCKKPLGCTDFRSSNIDEWILYNQHFKPYLQSKLEDRKYFYQKKDFKYLDKDTFEDNYIHAFKSSDWAKQSQINALMENETLSPAEIILSGVLPLKMSNSLLSLVRLQQEEKQGHTYRNGRTDTHD